MKIIITEDSIYIEGFDYPYDHKNGIDWSCRLSAHESIGWGIKRLGEELEKSVGFYRTGESVDNIVID